MSDLVVSRGLDAPDFAVAYTGYRPVAVDFSWSGRQSLVASGRTAGFGKRASCARASIIRSLLPIGI